MNISPANGVRVVSGMRPTGALHLGHYHGVIKNWLKLQNLHECFFFVADLHALTTHYADSSKFDYYVFDMVVDWLACGINPGASTLFIQSRIVEHAELHLLLSMITPQTWLERVPSYKDRQEKLSNRDLITYGFLGYPLLQSADILIYKANLVPVGEDQMSHIELTREVARRFNNIFGHEERFAEKVKAALGKMGKKNADLYLRHRRKFQEKGDTEAYAAAYALVNAQQNTSISDAERLLGYLDGSSRVLLPEPQALLTDMAKIPGTDGEKMSKSYENTIALRESDRSITKKIRAMVTDPARARRSDPGDPAKCPVWQLHQVYSDDAVKDWVMQGCRSASIGCVECKQPVIDAMRAEISPIREQALEYARDKQTIQKIILEGNEAAREVAHKTLTELRQATGLSYY